VIVIASESNGHLAANGSVSDGSQSCCIATINPAFLEIPKG